MRWVSLDPLDQLEPRHARQAEVEHDAVIRLLVQRLQRDLRGCDGGRLDVAIADQFGDRLALNWIVFDDQQLLDTLLDELADLVEAGF
jgi:hypothetical protein